MYEISHCHAGLQYFSRDVHGDTPLLRAVKGRQMAAMRALLAAGADMHAKDKVRRSLHQTHALLLCIALVAPQLLASLICMQSIMPWQNGCCVWSTWLICMLIVCKIAAGILGRTEASVFSLGRYAGVYAHLPQGRSCGSAVAAAPVAATCQVPTAVAQRV